MPRALRGLLWAMPRPWACSGRWPGGQDCAQCPPGSARAGHWGRRCPRCWAPGCGDAGDVGLLGTQGMWWLLEMQGMGLCCLPAWKQEGVLHWHTSCDGAQWRWQVVGTLSAAIKSVPSLGSLWRKTTWGPSAASQAWLGLLPCMGAGFSLSIHKGILGILLILLFIYFCSVTGAQGTLVEKDDSLRLKVSCPLYSLAELALWRIALHFPHLDSWDRLSNRWQDRDKAQTLGFILIMSTWMQGLAQHEKVLRQ